MPRIIKAAQNIFLIINPPENYNARRKRRTIFAISKFKTTAQKSYFICFHNIIMPIFFALLIAILLDPMVSFFQRLKLPRTVAITLALMAIFAYSNENLSEEFDSEYSEKKTELIDPFSGYNRLMTTFNDKVYLNVLNPTAKGYAYVVPETVRIGIDNFFNNLIQEIKE